MLRAISIENRIPNRHLFLIESYKQLADDYMTVNDFSQAIICSQKLIQIEKESQMQTCNTIVDSSPFENVLFIAEAYFRLKDYSSSNEELYKVLGSQSSVVEAANPDDGEQLTNEMMLKTFKMIARNFLHSQNFKEAIKFLMKAIKLIEEVHDKIELYQ